MSKLTFNNYGGSYQLRIQDDADLDKIQILDETHWAATSIPINTLNCDAAFLSYVDTDKNGRIRTDELKAALVWLFRFLANRSHLSEGTDVLNLGDIDTSHPEGQRLRQASEQILTNLNLPGAQKISLNQVRDAQSIMARAASNGDGIIPPEATADPDLAQFIVSVMESVGSALDASGKPGIGKEQLKAFFHEAEAYLAWQSKGEIPKGKDATEVMPWGVGTPQAYELIAALEEKIEQYFTQCAMVRFDERSKAEMKLRQKDLEEIDFTDKSIMEARLKDAPLAVPNPKGILNLEAVINSLYLEQISALKEKVLKRSLGETVKRLTENQWNKVKALFAPYRTWVESKQGTKVEKLGRDRLLIYTNEPFRQGTSELIAKDLSVADDLNQIHNLEKLILYQRWLMELANNFVSFTNLYNPEQRSLFEMGTLVIDGRQMTLTMRVEDRQAHKKIAEKSYMYLLYLEISGRQEEDINGEPLDSARDDSRGDEPVESQGRTIKFEIVAAVTSGAAGRLRIGKRGIFFTIDGQAWDAKMVDIAENPISLWESVSRPFQQFTDFIRRQIDKFAKSRQARLEESFTAPSASGIARDLLLGGSVAIAALGSAFAYITKAFSQVKLVHILATLVGVAIIILLPGIVVGFIKVRKRDMSTLLEASGLAVNVHMRMNAALGRLFTHTPSLPKGARKERKDVIAEFVRKFSYTSRRPVIVVLIAILISLSLMVALTTYLGLKPLF